MQAFGIGKLYCLGRMRFKTEYIPLFLCILGCAVQIIDISKRLFSFTTSTNVKIIIERHIYQPSLSVCFDIQEDVNQTKMASIYGIDYSQKWSVYRRSMRHVLDNMTVRDVFENSQYRYDILRENDACSLRESGSMTLRLRLKTIPCK